MRNVLILDLEQRLGAVMREIVASLATGVSLVSHLDGARRRLRTGLYDLAILSGLSDLDALELLREAEPVAPGLPVVLVRGLVHSSDGTAPGSFTAVLDEPFSPRRFRDVVLALMAAPRLLRQRLGRRRQVDLAVEITRFPEEDGTPAVGRVGNLSLGGALVVLPGREPARLGLREDLAVEMRTLEPRIRLEGTARVAYVDPGAGDEARVGLQLVHLEPGSADRLRAFMAGA